MFRAPCPGPQTGPLTTPKAYRARRLAGFAHGRFELPTEGIYVAAVLHEEWETDGGSPVNASSVLLGAAIGILLAWRPHGGATGPPGYPDRRPPVAADDHVGEVQAAVGVAVDQPGHRVAAPIRAERPEVVAEDHDQPVAVTVGVAHVGAVDVPADAASTATSRIPAAGRTGVAPAVERQRAPVPLALRPGALNPAGWRPVPSARAAAAWALPARGLRRRATRPLRYGCIPPPC